MGWSIFGYAVVAVVTLAYLTSTIWRDHHDPVVECEPAVIELTWSILASAVWPYYWLAVFASA